MTFSLPENQSTVLPENFLSYHLSVAFPNYVKTRPKHIMAVLDNFNIFGLLKNLLSPYKRMTITGRAALGEKLSFNVISMLVGATARTGLIIAGILVTLFFIAFDTVTIPVYLFVPVFSFLKYSETVEQHVTAADIANKTITKKLTRTKIYWALVSFFDNEFQNLFTIFPDPQTLGIKAGQKTYEAFLELANWQLLDNYLKKIGVKKEHFLTLVNYLYEYYYAEHHIKPVPLGEMLIFGYTNTLEKFSRELTKEKHPPFWGNRDILTRIEKILNRPQNNNVLLIGEPGVGKHSVLAALSSAIVKGQLPTLRDKRVVLLDIVALLATSQTSESQPDQTKTAPLSAQGTFESVLEEAKRAGNIILAISDIDRICSQQDGRTDLSEILTTVLTDNSLPLIGLATVDSFNSYIRPNANMTSLFERIDVEEPQDLELMTILAGKSLELYQSQKVATTLPAILEIIDKSNKLVADTKQPQKSILILEDAAGEANKRKLNQVDVTIVDTVLSVKTKTPVGKISQTEAQKLTDLEQILHKRIVGQNEAVEEIAKAMRRTRAELKKTSKPMGSFLFLGPTGVGKTETAKALAQAYFGDETRMVRLDMTEFQGPDATSRLIGRQEGKSPGQLTTQIREHPFGILLVDEFEKAAQDVQNLFLQILDEGILTDAFGKKVSFANIIVIATTNAAAEFIREQVDQGQTQNLPKKLISFVLEKGLFSPELINRFDATVVYKPLSKEEVVKVSYLMLINLARDLHENKNITLEITPTLAQTVASQGYVVAFGARPIRRLIQDKIEDEIAKLIISGNLKNGDTISAADLLKFVA